MSELERKIAKKESVKLVSTTANTTVQLVSSKKVNKVDHDHLMDLAEQIANSNSHVKAATTNKLKAIADQIKRLQEEAVKCLEDAKRDKQLHEAACNLVKKPGTVYHLYEKDLPNQTADNPITQAYFSIMSPSDWGAACPHKFLGSYRLGYDLQFTPVEELTESRINQENLMDQVYEQFTTGNLSIEAGSSSFTNALAQLK